MQILKSINKYLNGHSATFNIVSFDGNKSVSIAIEELGLDIHSVVRTVVFRDKDGMVTSLTPEDQSNNLITGQDDESTPFGAVYRLPLIVDKCLPEQEKLYFLSPSKDSFIQINASDFALFFNSVYFCEFSRPIPRSEDELRDSDTVSIDKKRIEKKLTNLNSLPAMPAMATRILQVTNDTNSSVTDLSKVIEVDPSLSAQIIRYATSAFYGYRGEISSVHDAIARVLGFDLVANHAMGIAIGKVFKIPAQGPLGLSRFWRHAVYCSALVERMAKIMPRNKGVRPGLAYLCGLLHDFGHLLLGHVYPPGFKLLNQYILANPHIPISTLELYVLGIEHGEIGAQLLNKWNMPEETVAAARWHHDESYSGDCFLYTQLVLIADRLLRRHGIGDGDKNELPESVLESLGLSEERVVSALSPLLETCIELDNLANQLAK